GSKRRTRYENRFRNRPISGRRDLSCYGPERIPELYPLSPAGRHCCTVHGCPLCLALPVGNLRVSAHRRCASAGEPLRIAGGGVAAPVIVNILTFHALMAPSGLPLALFVAVLWVVIFVNVRLAFSGLFQARLQTRA